MSKSPGKYLGQVPIRLIAKTGASIAILIAPIVCWLIASIVAVPILSGKAGKTVPDKVFIAGIWTNEQAALDEVRNKGGALYGPYNVTKQDYYVVANSKDMVLKDNSWFDEAILNRVRRIESQDSGYVLENNRVKWIPRKLDAQNSRIQSTPTSKPMNLAYAISRKLKPSWMDSESLLVAIGCLLLYLPLIRRMKGIWSS